MMFQNKENKEIDPGRNADYFLIAISVICLLFVGLELTIKGSIFYLFIVIPGVFSLFIVLSRLSVNWNFEKKDLEEKTNLGLTIAQFHEKLNILYKISEKTKYGIHHYSDLVKLLNCVEEVFFDIFPIKGVCCFVTSNGTKIDFFNGNGKLKDFKSVLESDKEFYKYLLTFKNAELLNNKTFGEKIDNLVIIPLCADGNGHGGIIISVSDKSFFYIPENKKLLDCVASILNTAYYNWHLFETRKNVNAKLNREVFKISVLYNIGKAISFIDDLKKLLSLILDKAISALNAQKGSLMLLNETDELVVRVVRGIDPDVEDKINSGEIQCTRFKLGEGIAGKVLESGKPLLINEGEKDSRFKNSTKTFKVDSIICVPLIAKEEPIGVINMTNKKSGQQFNEEDVELLNALASQAASAIKNAQLYEMAVTDGLTHLFTHRYFQGALDNEILRSKRYGANISIILTDIDHFKTFNDDFGHQAGDYVLAQVAKTIKSGTREIDTVARYGGEEFAIILPETGIDGCMVVAERLRKMVDDAEFNFEGKSFKVQISIGCSTFPIHSLDKMELIKFCDQSLYYAKLNGRNMAVSYEKIKNLNIEKPEKELENEEIEV